MCASCIFQILVILIGNIPGKIIIKNKKRDEIKTKTKLDAKLSHYYHVAYMVPRGLFQRSIKYEGDIPYQCILIFLTNQFQIYYSSS